jgi:hypothetical protein
MDCFVLPSDEHNGELVNFAPNQALDFRGKIEPGLFAALYGMLGDIAPEAGIPKTETRMVIGRLKDEKWSYYHFASSDRYQSAVPEAEIWRLIDEVFRKRLQERVKTDETIVD